jgi:hypothetical protein
LTLVYFSQVFGRINPFNCSKGFTAKADAATAFVSVSLPLQAIKKSIAEKMMSDFSCQYIYWFRN